jgi:hypothetical protein
MSFTIPQIAISSESNERNSSTTNIDDALTDVEDLDEGDSNRIKSNLKIKFIDDGATTDLEDLEASDTENDPKIQTVSLEDLPLDPCNVEEAVFGNLGKLSQSLKIKDGDSSSPDEGLTDAENFLTDEEPDFGKTPDADVNFDDYHSDYVNISSEFKQNVMSLAFPVLDVDELTDFESLGSDNERERLATKAKTKRRKTRGCYKSRDTNDDHKTTRCLFKMKKSLSHPVCLDSQNGLVGFESDGDAEDKQLLQFPLCKTVAKKERNVLTDTEEIEDFKCNVIGVEEKQKFVEAKVDSTHNETDAESVEGEIETEPEVGEIDLPPPVRTLIVLHEAKTLVPTTKILPLNETTVGGLQIEEDVGVTDSELVDDEGELLNVEIYKRGPTPEICDYENSSVVHGENQIEVLQQTILEPVTDTEDLAFGDRSKRSKKLKTKTLQVVSANEPPTTDTEDFYMSDSNKSPLKKRNVVGFRECFIDFFMNDTNEVIISSKGSDGTSVTQNRLDVAKSKSATTSPDLTDVEDLAASADEDVRSKTATPSEFYKDFDQQGLARVHIETTKKINLDSPNEIMYLKGGSYHQNHTDVEVMSDDDEADKVEAFVGSEMARGKIQSYSFKARLR